MELCLFKKKSKRMQKQWKATRCVNPRQIASRARPKELSLGALNRQSSPPQAKSKMTEVFSFRNCSLKRSIESKPNSEPE
jgi:hypothetical protein